MKIKTIEAMLEAERIDPNLKSYTVDEAFAGKGLPRLHSSEAHRFVSWGRGGTYSDRLKKQNRQFRI